MSRASKVIIDGADDNENFTCAYKLSQLVGPQCHISVFFEDTSKEQMLEQICPQIECSSSHIAEVLVRSMQDPGASRVTEELLSNLRGMNQYALQVPADIPESGIRYGELLSLLRQKYQATLLGVAEGRAGQNMKLNQSDDFIVTKAHFIHYIAEVRLHADDIDWAEMTR